MKLQSPRGLRIGFPQAASRRHVAGRSRFSGRRRRRIAVSIRWMLWGQHRSRQHRVNGSLRRSDEGHGGGAGPTAPPFIDPPGFARHRAQEMLLYGLVERDVTARETAGRRAGTVRPTKPSALAPRALFATGVRVMTLTPTCFLPADPYTGLQICWTNDRHDRSIGH